LENFVDVEDLIQAHQNFMRFLYVILSSDAIAMLTNYVRIVIFGVLLCYTIFLGHFSFIYRKIIITLDLSTKLI